MSENGSKKREWVKTAAIVFLSVLLVLTFFSNTIQNYSLPEVATQNVMSGTITAKIRGTGTVESGDPYEIKVTETRKVSSVAVRVGDTVQKGDVIVYLEDSESEELKAAKEALEAAQDDYDKALLTAAVTASDIYTANKDVSATALRSQITAAQSALQAAKDAVTPLQEKVNELTNLVNDFAAQIEFEQNLDTAAESRLAVTELAASTAKAAYDNANQELANAKTALESLTVSGGDAASIQKAQERVDNAQKAYTEAKSALDKAQSDYSSAQSNQNERTTSQTIVNLQSQKYSYEIQLYGVQKQLAEAEALQDTRQTELDDLIGSIGNVAELEAKLEAIAKAQEQVDELTAKSMNATVTADIAGTVTAINVTAGNDISAATPVAVLQPEGKGYTMSFSVTNEQAKRLSVGDKADLVNAWRYDDVEVTLSSIKPDTTDPGQKKLLTFDVSGSVTAGQTLNISVGQKSANFDYIVPNSAIREDNNGKFILIVESKSSPLGNRYVAKRVDVEVLASDDTQSAITGGVTGYEYVITTSSAPVEAGKLVRLADN